MAGRTVAAVRAGVARSAPLRTSRHAPDYGLFAVVAVLVVLGLLMVYSSSYAVAAYDYDDPHYIIRRQLAWAIVGFGALIVLMNIDYHWLQRLAVPLMVVTLLALALVIIPGVGTEVNGARRWLGVGPLTGQPSELAKLAVLVYMAAWLAAKGDDLKHFSLGVVPFVAIVSLVGGLILAEPDLGTAVMIGVITGTLFFVAESRLVHVLYLAAGALGAGLVLVLTAGYRMDRIFSFTSAEADPSGVGFQTLQLLVAFGSGGLWGLGLGVSRQKFFYVPGAYNDGVMSIVGEELGFVGAVAVLALFALLLWRAAWVAHRAPDGFGALLVTGVIAWIGIQALINIAGVTRMIPLTGIPLPFLSAGGSALATTLAAVGIVLSVSRYADHGGRAPEAEVRGAVRESEAAR